ncbi:hypothetical protein [Quisquiliibacterium transsilvanicum]|uniref:Uncharacterized protein n=1 Tax=Quisquiliibacterium transsilvanicum TaxID=1549638 RepID=A0A7W8HF93_9BURK|nr:hypothetical protein [Quisquiliibacterium transsilvanicum]MBB5270813.1 hypothetical protein [Quisquiliibacterium transsilvanicum]
MLADETSGDGAAPVSSGAKRMLLDHDAALPDDALRLPPAVSGRYRTSSTASFESRTVSPLDRPPIG